jgi:hypothetical protein
MFNENTIANGSPLGFSRSTSLERGWSFALPYPNFDSMAHHQKPGNVAETAR